MGGDVRACSASADVVAATDGAGLRFNGADAAGLGRCAAGGPPLVVNGFVPCFSTVGEVFPLGGKIPGV